MKNTEKTKINNEFIIDAKNLKKCFKNGEIITNVLNGANAQIKKGEFVAIMGPSGSGKSTLLHMIALLDDIDSGEIRIKGENVQNLSNSEKTNFRLNNFGYVFQDYNLILELSVLENVYLSLIQLGVNSLDAKKKALIALEKVGLKDYSTRYPTELSGGQQQRVSIARAIVNNPQILFADEPTANLDSTSRKNIMELFLDLNKKYGLTIIMVTHEQEQKKLVQRVIEILDGVVIN